MVWPVQNYTDKINTGVKFTLQRATHLTFTKRQMVQSLERGFPWLADRDERQEALLNRLVCTAVKRLVQTGQVKKVKSHLSVEPQWMWASSVGTSSYTDVTSSDSVAQTEEARERVSRRSINAMTLHRLNNVKPTI